MTKKNIFVFSITAVVIFWAIFLYARYQDLTLGATLSALIFLILTLLIPSGYILVNFFIKPTAVNDIHIVPMLLSTLFVIFNVIVIIFLTLFNTTNPALTIILEAILFTLYGILMLLAVMGSMHISAVNKKYNYNK